MRTLMVCHIQAMTTQHGEQVHLLGSYVRHVIHTAWIDSVNITIELMFAGVNMFLARLRFILARATGEG